MGIMKPRKNLKTGRDALQILRKQASGKGLVVTCPVAPRPQPRRQSALLPFKDQLLKLRDQGKTLDEIADWIGSVRGERPNRSTVLRQLNAKTTRTTARKVRSIAARHSIVFQGVQIEVIEQHGLLDDKQEADILRKAHAIVRDLTRYVPKAVQDKDRFPFRSVGTRYAAESVLRCFGRFLEASKLGHLGAVPVGACQLYLAARAAIGVGEDQMSKDRRALECVYGEDLKLVSTRPRRARPDRAITREQVEKIVAAQSPRKALSTEIAYVSGVRAFELLTIARIEDRPPSDRRWHKKLHLGLPAGVLFTVKGKGGLVRLIYLTKELARALETRRRPVPIMVTDRKRRHRSYYDIAGGDAWGAAFRKAAIKVYGESPGAHSTRHGYVLNRRRTLEQLGLGIHEIRSIISQELGHFRPEIVRESYEHEPWVPRSRPK